MAEQTFYYQLFQEKPYPLPPLTLHKLNNSIPVDALVDSGADFCFFNASVADDLKILIESGIKRQVNTPAGKITVYMHQIEIQLFERKINCLIAFSKEYKFSLNILGRLNFFEAHEITFKEKEKKINIKELN